MRKSTWRAYHGSPFCIERFDYAFTEHGDDIFGSGFYFATHLDEALKYASDKSSLSTDQLRINPTIHIADITMKNPLPSDYEGEITQAQVREIIRLAPQESREEGLWKWGDLGSDSQASVISDAAPAYAGFQSVLRGLNNLSNDFFQGEIRAFNNAVQKVLGYDGVIHRLVDRKNYFLVAWFPEQIQIIERTPAAIIRRNLQLAEASRQGDSDPSP
ncbi:hypothetical protein DV532_29705 (plasmid) [Pseudomonas sp. Leaf58]|uniref:ADP-ribosyltransferase-containing protein n=1 Tax=Pseudomonas sp. Leaf58 TaxID=1736226 RepID=UPI0006FB2797|nr:hypothetical protein [Pseudomonas sp. Leaf58]AYG48415.1 hypothetical protein DV532_29705 [Pseudomonas sp. Leaf58]KQN62040.1 hypothetical protein ASF02_07615 [Pseudomonas sp. Leaf58]